MKPLAKVAEQVRWYLKTEYPTIRFTVFTNFDHDVVVVSDDHGGFLLDRRDIDSDRLFEVVDSKMRFMERIAGKTPYGATQEI